MPKKVARVEDVIRLGQKMNWREVKSPNGEVVEPETIRRIYKYAAAGMKRKKARKGGDAPLPC